MSRLGARGRGQVPFSPPRGEDEGHFEFTLAVYAPHHDVSTTTRVRPSLVPRHRFRGAAVAVLKVLLPRDLCRRVFMLVREPCSASHSVNLACSDLQTLATKAARLRERYETVFLPVSLYSRSFG